MSPLVWLSVWSLLWNFLLFPWFPAFPAISGNRPGRKSSVNWKCEKEIVHLVHNYSVTGREPRKNWRYCTFVPPFCSWWLIMKKRGLMLCLSLNPNPRAVRKFNSVKKCITYLLQTYFFCEQFPCFFRGIFHLLLTFSRVLWRPSKMMFPHSEDITGKTW